ncbi:hypothetical protein A3Q56_02306 [Intoshia linei]|uniref:Mediator of RNA polymerase II transcription subunit 10 n=1 Tax=Intoshia linei TaxID=1819745 RepID=A0A177B8J7_9BILA|nr:hypothetical protein A3Q56_02306 [Intoshia linei]
MKKFQNEKEGIENHLFLCVENLRQLNMMTKEFQTNGQTSYNTKINSVIKNLAELENILNGIENICVPVELLQ